MNFPDRENRGVSAYGIAVLLVLLFFILIAVPQYKKIQVSVRKVTCAHKKDLLARSLEMCLNAGEGMIQPPFKEVDQAKLVQKNVLSVRVECGSGGIFKVDEHRRVFCTIHDASEDW